MLFVHPMWASETHRLGTRACSPAAYAVRVAADLTGMLGLGLVVFGYPIVAVNYLVRSVSPPAWWPLLIPIGLGLVSEALFQFSCRLIDSKGFRYDYEPDVASWVEAGERRKFVYERPPV